MPVHLQFCKRSRTNKICDLEHFVILLPSKLDFGIIKHCRKDRHDNFCYTVLTVVVIDFYSIELYEILVMLPNKVGNLLRQFCSKFYASFNVLLFDYKVCITKLSFLDKLVAVLLWLN